MLRPALLALVCLLTLCACARRPDTGPQHTTHLDTSRLDPDVRQQIDAIAWENDRLIGLRPMGPAGKPGHYKGIMLQWLWEPDAELRYLYMTESGGPMRRVHGLIGLYFLKASSFRTACDAVKRSVGQERIKYGAGGCMVLDNTPISDFIDDLRRMPIDDYDRRHREEVRNMHLLHKRETAPKPAVP